MKGQFDGAYLDRLSVTITAKFHGLSSTTVSMVMMEKTKHGKTSASKKNSAKTRKCIGFSFSVYVCFMEFSVDFFVEIRGQIQIDGRIFGRA